MSLRGRSSRSNPRLQWETASFLAVTSHLDYWKKLFWTAINQVSHNGSPFNTCNSKIKIDLLLRTSLFASDLRANSIPLISQQVAHHFIGFALGGEDVAVGFNVEPGFACALRFFYCVVFLRFSISPTMSSRDLFAKITSRS